MQGYSPKLPLQKDLIDGVYALNKTSLEAIKQDLKMLLLTNPGERMMNPDYGVGIRQLLFSPKGQNLSNELTGRIKNQVKKYMNFLVINSLNIIENEQNENMILVNLSFSIPALNVSEQLNLDLSAN